MEPLYAALEAYNARDYAQAKYLWELCSEHPDALVNLGTLYARGYGVTRDLNRARALFIQALPHEVAALYLGGMYENGISVEASSDRAIEYYRIAAQGNLSQAQLKMGLLLRESDPYEAMHWMILAAHAGETQAHELIHYVSNHAHAQSYNESFRALSAQEQHTHIAQLIEHTIAPILARDGGGIELVHYVAGELPQIWLRYRGACSGCHLGPTTTASMVLEHFERSIDGHIVLYLW